MRGPIPRLTKHRAVIAAVAVCAGAVVVADACLMLPRRVENACAKPARNSSGLAIVTTQSVLVRSTSTRRYRRGKTLGMKREFAKSPVNC
jgi:hypothetical protein